MIIDFHSHILPGADHGSRRSSEAEEQFATISNSGVDLVIATPHFYPHADNSDEFFDSVNPSIERVRRFKDKYPSTQLCVGVEVLALEMIAKMPDLERFCIRGTRCVLLEMPSLGSWSGYLLDGIEEIIDAGFTVILAHIDRYISRYKKEIDRLLEAGALAQINADGLKPFFLRKKLMPYIDGGKVCAIGSDLHGTHKKAYNAFREAEKRIGTVKYRAIMDKAAELLRDAERM